MRTFYVSVSLCSEDGRLSQALGPAHEDERLAVEWSAASVIFLMALVRTNQPEQSTVVLFGVFHTSETFFILDRKLAF